MAAFGKRGGVPGNRVSRKSIMVESSADTAALSDGNKSANELEVQAPVAPVTHISNIAAHTVADKPQLMRRGHIQCQARVRVS